ncbi:MAG: ferrous iron transport protein A [Treponema sp.]|nr:ferrous iron transport protein A [Treponema sp.]
MPLSVCNFGETFTIRKVGGKPEVRQHLNELGFHAGSSISIINDISGNLIVRVKDSRIALNKAMAAKIVV